MDPLAEILEAAGIPQRQTCTLAERDGHSVVTEYAVVDEVYHWANGTFGTDVLQAAGLSLKPWQREWLDRWERSLPTGTITVGPEPYT